MRRHLQVEQIENAHPHFDDDAEDIDHLAGIDVADHAAGNNANLMLFRILFRDARRSIAGFADHGREDIVWYRKMTW